MNKASMALMEGLALQVMLAHLEMLVQEELLD